MTDSGTPEFGGKCAFAVAVGGVDKAPAGNPKCTLEQDGKTYYFKNRAVRALFKAFKLARKAESKAVGAA